MSINKNKMKKIIGIVSATVAGIFVTLNITRKEKKGNSVYRNKPERQNPFVGKKVVFIHDEDDKENADGVRGHLEAVGDIDYYPSFYEKYVKRAIDVILSFGGLVVLSPIYAGIALLIIIDDPGPILFTQKRLGQNKKYFKLHKFRSMKMSTPHDVPTHMLENPEQYITKVGKFLRAHSFDELPQIWDIFVSNMSVIGPRPGLWNQGVLTAERDKYGANNVKPGLTGWAQINGRDELEIPEKAKLDGEYVNKMGFLMDMKCFFGSIRVLKHDDSVVEGGTGRMSKAFRNYTDGKTDSELIGNIGFGEAVVVNKENTRRVLITGAGSYIGETFKIYANEKYPSLEIDAIDMIDGAWREKNFAKYDIVYHVAGLAHADVGNVDDEIKAKYYAVNTDLAVDVCQKAKKEGVKEFIFMSSMIVYGESAPYGKEKIVDENTVPKAASFYGDSKLQADVAVRELADSNYKVIVLRPPMIYGWGSKGNYPTLAKLAKKLPVFPNVENQRSMLYIGSLCEFLCQIMLIDSFERDSVVLIPQNAEWTNTSEMVKIIADVSGKRIFKLRVFKPAVLLGGRMPGKIGGLVNKAFGNNCYIHSISTYEGVNYQNITLYDSIVNTEREMIKKKDINKMCIVSCFDTYEHRVDLIQKYFEKYGVEVTVYTSDFRHFEKCTRTDSKKGFKFFHAIPYSKNMSIGRLKSHVNLAKIIFKEVQMHNFDLLWVLIPPNSFVKEAQKYKKMHRDVKLIFDLIDLWPETMPISRFKSLPPFSQWKNLRDKYLCAADEIVTECKLYHNKLPQNIKDRLHTIYLARESTFIEHHYNLPDNKIVLCYLGSINNIIDIPAIVELIQNISSYKEVELHIIGDGERRDKLISLCEGAGASVLYHGKIYNKNKKHAIFDSCHYGVNFMKCTVFVGLTMKSIDYFEAGLPIINNIKGDTWELVKNNNIGYNIGDKIDYEKLTNYDFSMRKRTREVFEEQLGLESFNSRISEMFEVPNEKI